MDKNNNTIKCPLCGAEMNYYHSMLTARCTRGFGHLDGVFWSAEEVNKAIINGTKVRKNLA